MYLAHSKNEKGKEQTYLEHVVNVCIIAKTHVSNMVARSDLLLNKIVALAGERHDLGKLHKRNQEGLKNPKEGNLPFHHSDAGTASLLKKSKSRGRYKDIVAQIAALLVSAHHYPGLRNFSPRDTTAGNLRDDTDYAGKRVQDETDKHLSKWEKIHAKEIKPFKYTPEKYRRVSGMFIRMGLSCLVDGDHTDTANHYENIVAEEQKITLRPRERLRALEKYVESKWNKCNKKLAVNKIRNDYFKFCRKTNRLPGHIGSCPAALGNGKTTAVPAHLLNVASDINARKLFVILPFTNIITQSVQVYRKALVLPGENPDDVVAEHQHKVDFDYTNYQGIYNASSTKLWRQPIVVTTAVQFFETLASNRGGRLRKLHELTGSVIFIDEAHQMPPKKLLALGFKYLEQLVDDFGCYVILGSGTQNDFWKLDRFYMGKRKIRELTTPDFRKKDILKERNRIRYCRPNSHKLTIEELEDLVFSKPGPRLVVMNTVRNAAVFAAHLKRKKYKVEHLSTALQYSDTVSTIARIKRRLASKQKNWVLVATSVIEAGMDFSFQNGFREVGPLPSIGQTGGRVNRECILKDSRLYLFELDLSVPIWRGLSFNEHPKFRAPIALTKDLIDDRGRTFDFDHDSFVKYFRDSMIGETTTCDEDKFVALERQTLFEDIAKEFSVIDDEGSLTALLSSKLFRKVQKKVRVGERINWKEIQKNSFRLSANADNMLRLEGLTQQLEPDQKYERLYLWKGRYDKFIGYMAEYFGAMYNRRFR